MTIATLVVALAAIAPTLPQPKHPGVTSGIGQAREGLLDSAVETFDRAILELAEAGEAGRPDLLVAHVHRGAALVGLRKEDAAKEAFRQALVLEPALRLPRGEFSDRVVRVFEAARTGKRKSVMERPTDAPRKAGIGAAGVAAIAGGVALVAGGAAVVAGKSDASAPSPTPSPSPTPDPAAQVAEVPGTRFGSIRFEVVNLSPPSGTVVNGCGATTASCARIELQVRLSSDWSFQNIAMIVKMRNSAGTMCLWGAPNRFDLRGGEPFLVAVNVAGAACAPPLTVMLMDVSTTGTNTTGADAGQQWSLRYTFNP